MSDSRLEQVVCLLGDARDLLDEMRAEEPPFRLGFNLQSVSMTVKEAHRRALNTIADEELLP